MPANLLRVFESLCLLLFLGSCAFVERISATDLQTDIEEIASATIERPLLNSVSIGVVHEGNSYVHHAGELEFGKSNRPTNETLYEIGSLSKTLAGTLVANAVLENKLSLDDPVHKFLGEGYSGLAFGGEPIRVGHLLSHTGQLPNSLPFEVNQILEDFTEHDVPAELSHAYDGYGKAEFMKDLRNVVIEETPGSTYSYSSAGAELIAHILESVYTADYEDLLVEYFRRSAGMNETMIRMRESDRDRLAVGYHSDNPVPTNPMPQLPWGASGNVKSTVPDMIKFIELQLAKGAVVRESHRRLADFGDFSAGYFWNIIVDDDDRGFAFFHHGGVPRSQCYIYIIPKYDLGIFIITNQSGDHTADALEWALEEIIKGVEARETKAKAQRQ